MPGQQFFHAVGGPGVDDADHMAQPGFRLDAVKFAATDQAVHHCRTVTTTIRAEEHVVTAPQRNHPEGVFILNRPGFPGES